MPKGSPERTAARKKKIHEASLDEDIAEWLSANEIWLNGIMDL